MNGVTLIETEIFEKLISRIDNLERVVLDIKDTRKPYLTITEVSEMTGFSPKWVRMNKDNIGCSKVGGDYRFKRKDVEEYIELNYFKIGRKNWSKGF